MGNGGQHGRGGGVLNGSMTRTTENLLTWAPLGAAVALMLSDHKRIGLVVGAVSPITVAWRHPRATRRALRAVPRSLKDAGKGVAKMGRRTGYGAKRAGKAFRWMAS